MFNSLPAPILLDIYIFFTALAWSLGFLVAGLEDGTSRQQLFFATTRVAALSGTLKPV
jgi:hypothetical protein